MTSKYMCAVTYRTHGNIKHKIPNLINFNSIVFSSFHQYQIFSLSKSEKMCSPIAKTIMWFPGRMHSLPPVVVSTVTITD